MNNRAILTGFAILVLGGIVALIVALGSSGDDGGDGGGDKVARGATTVSGTDGAGSRGRGAGGTAPSLPNADPAKSGDTPSAPPTIYMTDGGVLVRDHRSDRSKSAPVDNLPSPRDKPDRMSSGAVIAVRGALRKVVRDCERSLSQDATGDEPRVQAVVTVTVVSEELTVDEVDVNASDIADAEAMRTCMRDGFAGAKVPVPGQKDIASFKQTHPFRLGR